MKNFVHDNMTGKEGYVYGGSRQYHGFSGIGNCSFDSCSYLLGGMKTVVLTKSRKYNSRQKLA